MKRISLVIIGITLAAFSVGCTPSPEKVCTHFDGLNDKKKKKDDDAPKPSKMEQQFKELCPKMLAGAKEENAEAYKCFAKCVVGTEDVEVAQKCDNNCDGFKAAQKTAMTKLMKDEKKKSSDDDEAEAPKKKKASDDDEAPKKKKKASDDE